MAITDIKYPEYVEAVQCLSEGEFFRGGIEYGYFYSGNSYTSFKTGNVKNFDVADYEILPVPEGYTWLTDWFDVFEFANGYKIQFKIEMTQQPTYSYLSWRTVDHNGVEDLNIPNYSGKGSVSRADVENTDNWLRIALFTTYPVSTGMLEPDLNTPASDLTLWWFFGSKGVYNPPVDVPALNLNEFSSVTKCNYYQLDELHATFDRPLAQIFDIEAFNAYMGSHGNPIPTDYPIVVKDGLPNEYDPSGPGGGDGNYNDHSDPIDFPGLPTGGALACGAIHAFSVNTTVITQLFQKLWSTSIFDMATWQKLVSSPLDCIISLHALPVTPSVGDNPRDIWFGNFNTALSAPVVNNQYLTVDCGYIDVVKFFGSAMDYSPYTKISIFIPFSGIHDLATEDVQGSRVHIKYNIDVLTGDCAINVKCGQSVLYKFTGNMKMQIPITSRDDNALGNTIKGSVGMIAGAVVGGAIGNAPGAIAGATLSAAASVAAHKVTVSRSGEITGNVGILDEFTPYLIIHRPQQSLAVNYNRFKGYPSNITMTLGSCTGYTEVEHIHLTGISGATDTELNEIEQMLKAGVII